MRGVGTGCCASVAKACKRLSEACNRARLMTCHARLEFGHRRCAWFCESAPRSGAPRERPRRRRAPRERPRRRRHPILPSYPHAFSLWFNFRRMFKVWVQSKVVSATLHARVSVFAVVAIAFLKALRHKHPVEQSNACLGHGKGRGGSSPRDRLSRLFSA